VLVLVQVEYPEHQLLLECEAVLVCEVLQLLLDGAIGGLVFGVDEEDDDGLVWTFVDFADEAIAHYFAEHSVVLGLAGDGLAPVLRVQPFHAHVLDEADQALYGWFGLVVLIQIAF